MNLGDAKTKSCSNETPVTLDDAHERHDHSPGHHDDREPQSRGHELEDHIAWDLTKRICDEEDRQTDIVLQSDEVKIFGQAGNLCVSNYVLSVLASSSLNRNLLLPRSRKARRYRMASWGTNMKSSFLITLRWCSGLSSIISNSVFSSFSISSTAKSGLCSSECLSILGFSSMAEEYPTSWSRISEDILESAMAAEDVTVQKGWHGMWQVLGERAEPSVSKGSSNDVAYVGAWAAENIGESSPCWG
jgi:hypothetical protein